MAMQLKYTMLSLVVLVAPTKQSVNADQTTARLAVRARVVHSCKVSTPGSVASVTEALDSVRVRCDERNIWRVDVDSGKPIGNAQATSDVIRVTINF